MQPSSQQSGQAWASGLYSGTANRPQQAPDGRLSDLLNNPHSSKHQPASQAASQPRPAPGAMHLQGIRTHPAMQQASPGPLGEQQHQAIRGQAVAGQPRPCHSAALSGGTVYRPPASHEQVAAYISQATGQTYQPQSVQWAQPGMQQRPAYAQAPATMHYSALRPQGYNPHLSMAATQQYNAIGSTMRPGFAGQPLQYQPVPLALEDRKVLPRKSLKRKAVAAAGDESAEMEPALEEALVQLADDFITSSVAFACGLARTRKSKRLEAADVVVYLQRTWQLQIPGFSGPQVKPYKRLAAKDVHQARTAAVRKERSAASEAAAAAEERAEAQDKVGQSAAPSILPD